MNATSTATITVTIESLAAQYSDRKVNENDITAILRSLAGQYIYEYTGTFQYMLNLHYNIVGLGYLMTDRQAAGALNCAIAQYRYESRTARVQDAANAIVEQVEAAPAPAAATATQVVTDGTYTIVGSSSHRTIKLQTVDESSPRQWLSFLCGSDNEGDYKSVGFVTGSTVTLFNKYTGQYPDILAAAKYLVRNADRIGEFGKNYAVRSGKCWKCNRKLTTPESVTSGIGPVCAGKL